MRTNRSTARREPSGEDGQGETSMPRSDIETPPSTSSLPMDLLRQMLQQQQQQQDMQRQQQEMHQRQQQQQLEMQQKQQELMERQEQRFERQQQQLMELLQAQLATQRAPENRPPTPRENQGHLDVPRAAPRSIRASTIASADIRSDHSLTTYSSSARRASREHYSPPARPANPDGFHQPREYRNSTPRRVRERSPSFGSEADGVCAREWRGDSGRRRSSRSPAKSYTARPPTFDGKIPWAEFEIQFETVAAINRWDSSTKAAILVANLRGAATSFLTTLSAHDLKNYEKLKSTLNQRYGDEHLRKLYWTRLESRRQRPDEDLAALGQDIEKLGRAAMVNCDDVTRNEITTKRFISAITDPDLQHALSVAGPPTLREAVAKALELEALNKQFLRSRKIRKLSSCDSTPERSSHKKRGSRTGGDTSTRSRRSSPRARETCAFCKKRGHSIDECFSLKNKQEKEKENKQKEKEKEQGERMKRNETSEKCQICRRVGHLADRCYYRCNRREGGGSSSDSNWRSAPKSTPSPP